jgi:hypothetical protein
MSPLDLEAGVVHCAGGILERKLLVGKAHHRGMRPAEVTSHPRLFWHRT